MSDAIYVTNQNGTELDFTAAVEYMDDDIREDLHIRMAPCSEQVFFTAYEVAHCVKYGEPWFLSQKHLNW